MSLRVLLTADAVGGVWQYATDLARGLAALGHEPVVALTGPAPSDAQRAEAAGLELIETGLPLDWLAETPGEAARAARRMADIAGDLGCDAAQLNAPALADAEYPCPTVAVAHSCLATWWAAVKRDEVLPEAFAWRNALHRDGLRAADAVVTPSLAFARATRAAHGLCALPQVVHNGRRPLPVVAAAPHDFAFTAGRLWDEGKDVARLDRAAARLAVPFKAAGPLAGPDGTAVRFDHLHALGRVDEAELAGILSARPVFASAARYEPFGLAVLEAAQAGCPLVLSDTPTFRELWDGAARFATAGDEAGFAGAIETLVGDEAMRRAAGTVAAERAQVYTVEAMAGRMAELYRRLAPARRFAAARAARAEAAA